MNKVTIVTGGSRGIGAATAKACAAAGHKVVVNYVSNKDAAEEVIKYIKANGGDAIALKANTAIETDVVGMFDATSSQLGPVTALVNNAGIHGPRVRLDELSDADIDISNKI